MHRHFRPLLKKFGHEGKRHRDEALHVAGAPPEQLSVALDCAERVARPVLSFDRHHIGVARQNDATRPVAGSERCEEIGLAAILVHHALRADAVAGQIGFNEADQVEIGEMARRIERNELFDHLAGCEALRRGHGYELPAGGLRATGVRASF